MNCSSNTTISNRVRNNYLYQEKCSKSDDITMRINYVKFLLMGMFYSKNDDVRIESSLLVCRHLLRYDIAGIKDSSINILDPLAEDLQTAAVKTLQQKYLESSVKLNYGDSGSFQFKKSFSHSEVKNLFNIVFGKFDLSIRTTATRQLHLILSNDEHIFATSDNVFLATLVQVFFLLLHVISIIFKLQIFV